MSQRDRLFATANTLRRETSTKLVPKLETTSKGILKFAVLDSVAAIKLLGSSDDCAEKNPSCFRHNRYDWLLLRTLYTISTKFVILSQSVMAFEGITRLPKD